MNSSNGASCLSGGSIPPNSSVPVENTDVYHVSLMRRAIMEQKHIVPIEHILLPNKIRFLTAGLLVLCMNVQMQMGYPLVQHTPFVCFCFVIRRDVPRQSQYNQARGSMVIKDLTGHYKSVSLVVARIVFHPQDAESYYPPFFNRDCPQGISPFIPQSLWKQCILTCPFMHRMYDDLKRKLYHLQSDVNARKEGRIGDATWKEAYLKRNVKKKQSKTRNCELCRVAFNNYLEVGILPDDDH